MTLVSCISEYRLFMKSASIAYFSLDFPFNFQLHSDVCGVYTKFLSGNSLNLQSTPNSPSSGRLERKESAPISPSGPNQTDATQSPLCRPSSEALLEKTSPADLRCSPMECSPEGAQIASSQGLKTPLKSPGISCVNGSPRRTSSRLTPSKRLISDSGLLESPSSPTVRLTKSPKAVGPHTSVHGSPRRPSSRSLAPDLNAAAVVNNNESPGKVPKSPAKSPRKVPKSPAKSPRKVPKSPAKSPRKVPKSPAKTSSEIRVGESSRKMLFEKKSIDSEGQQSQQAMSRSDLRR